MTVTVFHLPASIDEITTSFSSFTEEQQENALALVDWRNDCIAAGDVIRMGEIDHEVISTYTSEGSRYAVTASGVFDLDAGLDDIMELYGRATDQMF